ncbi:spermatogenesis-associated protein 1 isoform X2 [Puntigrus tetrazona]|uniref:spermatogenesis-associated protein 1 isoform X2 n=1 Tax=Puntigrus tetrazona TaxID=1606681 RepID=UPI001C88F33A|nr:spermatogenesis-associated protein 1 isoform X2 [Puntigrus tetrazona]
MSGFTGKRTEFTERVELHVFYVPDDQFDRRLNKVSAEAVDTFISAGFIRVDSDVSLSDLRSDLGTFLGLDRIADRYVFLKCVGRSLALVKFRQEKELTVKSFTPPFDAEDESDEDTGSSDTPHLTYGLQDQMESLHKQSEIDTAAKKKHCFKKNNRNCGATELFEDSRGLARNFSSSLTLKSSEERTDDMVLMSRPTSPLPAERSSPLSVYSLELYTQETTTKNKLIEEIKLFKEQRKELERSRQELLKKGRELLALNRHRRNQARDQWKRQYFNTKKATILLEDTLKSVRLDLHTFYCKMLQQLQARDGAKGQTQGKKQSSTKLKNDLIIQIMTESSEIDNLRKNVDDVKMKLATESKLRKQAATELRALRAELMQKRAQL